MDIYAENIMDHYNNPRNKGSMDNFDYSFHKINSSCGDEITVYIKTEKNKIIDIKYEGNGCAISQSSISIISEILVGKDVEEIKKYDFDYIKDVLGIEISERRYNCSMLGLEAIKESLM